MQGESIWRTEMAMERTEKSARVFSSFEEENRAEHQRLAEMSHDERCAELAVLQERAWGALWTSVPMTKVASWEKWSG